MTDTDRQAQAEAMRLALDRAAGAAAPVFLDGGQAVVAAWRRSEPQVRAAYMAAGAPFGPTDEGLWRWLRDGAVIDRLRAEPDLTATWQQVRERLNEHTSRPP